MGTDMKRKQIIALVALAVMALLFSCIFAATRPSVEAGVKTVMVKVVHADGSQKEYEYHTDKEYLGELLLSEGLVHGETGEYGLYITRVDGEDAVYEKDGAYWALYENDDYASQGADTTSLTDGGCFSLVYKSD